MIMIDNKTARLAMLERYLAAETTPAEEVALRQYYSSHPVDKDEKAIAQLIVATHPEHDYLSDESVCDSTQKEETRAQQTRHLDRSFRFGSNRCRINSCFLSQA